MRDEHHVHPRLIQPGNVVANSNDGTEMFVCATVKKNLFQKLPDLRHNLIGLYDF
jgi:hypothetical protein